MNVKIFLMKVLVALVVLSGVAYAADKILFFTAGPVPTVNEKAEIAALNAQAAAPYVVRVRNSLKARSRSVEAADYVAGAIPPNYRDGGTDASPSYHTVFVYTNPPDPESLPSAQAILRNGDSLAIPGGGSVTVTVSSNTATVSAYLAPDAS
jgi:hypothetical protein